MLARAFAAGVPAQWVVGDTLYGYDELRTWLEERHKSYVLAIPETHLVWIAGRQHPIGYQAALLPSCAWTVLSAGEGSQGPRRYEWAWFQLSEVGEEGAGRGQAGGRRALCCCGAVSPIQASVRTTAWQVQLP